MGGSGGLGGLLTPYFGSNIGNSNISNPTARIIANILDLSGGSTFTTMNAAEMTGATSGGNTASQVLGNTPKNVEPVVEPIPEDPAIAQAATSEAARQEEMRKRRLRTKTLLSDQADTGMATTGGKVLLGG